MQRGLAERWRAVSLRDLPGLVAYEGAAIWLFRRLRAVAALDALPADISDRLRQMAFEAAASRLEVEAEAAAAVSLLSQATVPVILIKGVARCALAARFPYLDARATLDVDLLVPHGMCAAADAALRADGYVPASLPDGSVTPHHHHHLPPLHKGRITVELHDSTSPRIPPELAWARASRGAETTQWAGRSVRLPCATELAWSAIAHAMEDEARGFRLSRFLEVAALVSEAAPIDWAVINERSVTDQTFDSGAGVRDQRPVIGNWIGAALTLVAPDKQPAGVGTPGVDLAGLLEWRLGVLHFRPKLGRALSERLLAEGAREVAGLPVEPSPADASWWGARRRRVAGHASRTAFRVWRTGRRR